MFGNAERWVWKLGVAALVGLALSACETGPAPPLLSPIQVARIYGYSEVPTGENKYQVTYIGPSQRTGRSIYSRAATGTAQRTQAFDFTLWRAAQLAQANGFQGFRVSNVRSNVDSYPDDPIWAPDPWWGGGWHHHGFWGDPWWGPGWGPGWGSEWEPSPWAISQTEVDLDVTLVPRPGAGEYNAQDVINQLRQTYPGAEGTAVQPITPQPASAKPSV